MDMELTPEQEVLLCRIAIQTRDLPREKMHMALLAAFEEKLRQKQMFLAIMRANGLSTRMDENFELLEPDCMEEFEEIFGYQPSAQECEDYVNAMYETATMELDLEDIVLSDD